MDMLAVTFLLDILGSQFIAMFKAWCGYP